MSRSKYRAALLRPLKKFLRWSSLRLEQAETAFARASLPQFATPAAGLVIQLPRVIQSPERIYLGSNVKFGPNSVLKVKTAYPGHWLRHPNGAHVEMTFDPVLHIGDRVTATGGLEVTVYDRVTIEDDVTFAGNVFISDGNHASLRGDVPYKYQGIGSIAPIHIGRGSWIGKNAVILPGVSIGAHTIIGANAVVSRDVPAGCIAVGMPARTIRSWDAEQERWLRVDGASTHDGTVSSVTDVDA